MKNVKPEILLLDSKLIEQATQVLRNPDVKGFGCPDLHRACEVRSGTKNVKPEIFLL